MMRKKLRRPRRSAHLIGVVVDAEVDVVAEAKVNAISGATIIWMRIETVMKMVFKRGSILGCDIAVVRSVDEMDFMPLGIMILTILPCLLTTIIGNCQGRLLVLQLAPEPLREAEWALKPNFVWIFLK